MNVCRLGARTSGLAFCLGIKPYSIGRSKRVVKSTGEIVAVALFIASSFL